jgi:cell division protein FtsL
MNLPKNGVAKEIRHYVGSLFIFLLIMSIIFILMKYPVLETNKEVVMMLIGTLAASIGLVVSTITGSKPDDVNSLKSEIDKKNHQIEMLVKAKDNLEHMIIDLQKQILENQDNVMDKIILKAALDFDDRETAKKTMNKNA